MKTKSGFENLLGLDFTARVTFLVERIREDSNALCFQVVYAISLIWDFYSIVRVKDTRREQFRVKFQVSKRVYEMIETVWSDVT